jgi:N-acetylmuramoyl-L-alanine amidase
MAMTKLLLILALLLGLPVVNPGQGTNGVTIMLDAAAPTQRRLPLPPIEGPQGLNRPLVVIDAGHGGRDPGAPSTNGKVREKEVTLAIARAIRDALVASGRVRVALTRSDDRYLPLRDRYEIARRLKADLFISVHADAAPNPAATGATIYTLSEVASDAEAASLAARENKSDIIEGVPLGAQDAGAERILIDLAQRESMDISAQFAALLYRESRPLVPFRPDPHQFAALMVLKAPDTPSILFEAGYLTHTPDLAFVTSPEGQSRIAQGMRRAIEAHFARRIAGIPARRI